MRSAKTFSRLGVAVRTGEPQTVVDDLKRQIKAETLEAHIRKTVDSAPPLTREQRERLAAVLQGGGADG
jgi:hypothetical protein